MYLTPSCPNRLENLVILPLAANAVDAPITV